MCLKVELSFLMVGHTHADIDQFFSLVSRKLFPRPAKTLSALKEIVRTATDKFTVNVEETRRVHNVRSYLEEHLAPLEFHTNSHAFMVSDVDGAVQLLAKEWGTDEQWTLVGELLVDEPEGAPADVDTKLDDLEAFRAQLNRVADVFAFTTEEKREWVRVLAERCDVARMDQDGNQNAWDLDRLGRWTDRVPAGVPAPQMAAVDNQDVIFRALPIINKRGHRTRSEVLNVRETIMYRREGLIRLGIVTKIAGPERISVNEWEERRGEFIFTPSEQTIRKADIVYVGVPLLKSNRLPKKVAETLAELRRDEESAEEDEEQEEEEEEEEDAM